MADIYLPKWVLVVPGRFILKAHLECKWKNAKQSKPFRQANFLPVKAEGLFRWTAGGEKHEAVGRLMDMALCPHLP